MLALRPQSPPRGLFSDFMLFIDFSKRPLSFLPEPLAKAGFIIKFRLPWPVVRGGKIKGALKNQKTT
jgi:hypothetical protein